MLRYSPLNDKFKFSFSDLNFLYLNTLIFVLAPWLIFQNITLSILTLTCLMPCLFWIYCYMYYDSSILSLRDKKFLKIAYQESCFMSVSIFIILSLDVLKNYVVVNLLFINVVSYILSSCVLLLFCRLVYFIYSDKINYFAKFLICSFCFNIIALGIAFYCNVALNSFTFLLLIITCNSLLLIQDSYNFPSDISAIVFGLFIGFFLGFLLFFYLKIDFILCFTALGSALSFFVFSVFNLITHLEKLSIDSEYVNIECNNINYFDVFFKLSTSVVFSYLLGVFFVYKNLYISSILIAFTQPVLFFVVIIGVLFFTAYYLIKYKQQSDIGKILCHFLPYDFIKLNFKQTADNKKVDKPDPAKEQNDCKIETSLGCVVLYNQTVKKYIEKTDLTEPWAKSELEFHNLYESDNKELKEECIGGKTYFTFRQNRYSKEEGWFLLRDLEDQVSYFNSYLLIKSAFEQLNILYRLKIIHNDVKSDNLFFNIISQSVKLIDFGISVNMELSEQALPLTWPCKLNESDLTPAHREEINSAQSVQRRAYHHLRQNLNYDFQVFVKKISKIRKPDTKKILKEKSTKITSVAINKPKIYFSWAILAFASLLNFLGCENVFILLAFFIVAGCSFSELKNFKITSQQDFISPQDFKAEQTPHVYFDDNQPSYEQAKYINSL